ncbi:MAG: phosphoserine phosphatase [Halobacteriota archaeon]
MLKDLQEKKALLKKDAEASKLERNRLNSEASQFATKRDELNTKTRTLIDQAQQYKDKRDEYNILVSENKERREKLNEKANNLLVKADQIKKRYKVAGGLSLSELKREIDHLEFRQQTEVLSTEKERDLVDRIAHLWEQYRQKKGELENNTELREILDKAKQLRDEASEHHKQVTINAELAQEYHDNMLASFKEADQMRAEADAAHKDFVLAQEMADEQHHKYIKMQKELRDYDKVIFSLYKKSKETRESREKVQVLKRAEEVYAMFKEGQKLETEDLLLLQRSGLL